MNLHKKAFKTFLFWLVAITVGIVTYVIYLGRPGVQFFQVVLLSSLFALSIIYFLLRARKLGKNWATLLAAGWFIGTSSIFTMIPSADARTLILVLLGVGILFNLALTVIFRRRTLRDHSG